MDALHAQHAWILAQHRRLCKQHATNVRRANDRRERAGRVGTVVFCHLPDEGLAIATALKRKYKILAEMTDEEVKTMLETQFLATPVSTLSGW